MSIRWFCHGSLNSAPGGWLGDGLRQVVGTCDGVPRDAAKGRKQIGLT